MHNIISKIKKFIRPFKENPQNQKFADCGDSPDITIYGFYHIYCANNWQDIFSEQLLRLKASGLLDITTQLYLTVIGNKSDVEFINKEISPIKNASIIWSSENSEAFEFPALEAMYSLATHQDFYAYYFHTKGASNSAKTLNWYKNRVSSLRELKRNSKLWRYLMEYWIIDNWQLAIKVLSNGYNAYGCIKRHYTDQYQYYGGNFWWTKATHIRSRIPLTSQYKSNRYNAETWLLNGDNNSYDAFSIHTDSTAVPALNAIYCPQNRFDYIRGYCIYQMFHIRFTLKKLSKRIFKISF